jgi:hypothetical protein
MLTENTSARADRKRKENQKQRFLSAKLWIGRLAVFVTVINFAPPN